MRVFCPRCSKRYQVDPAGFGPGGARVTCESCGGAWVLGPWAPPDHVSVDIEPRAEPRLKPHIWLFEGDPVLDETPVITALATAELLWDVRRVPVDRTDFAPARRLPDVLVFGASSIRERDVLVGALAGLPSVSRVLLSTQPEDWRLAKEWCGLDRFILLPLETRSILAGLERVVAPEGKQWEPPLSLR